jgi:class 3 adenylate cyclase
MFCDLVGSTALARGSARSDRRLSPLCHDTVAEYADFVTKYMGDGALVYFGYPQAHEDDAKRAVRAGLAVIDAIGRLATPEGVERAAPRRQRPRRGRRSDRVGYGTGTPGCWRAAEPAARLQTLAAPGKIVIAESTRRQVGAMFEFGDPGSPSNATMPSARRAMQDPGALDRTGRVRASH